MTTAQSRMHIRYTLLALGALVSIAHAASAQRISLGGGLGIAGSTDASLSDGRVAPVLMGQLTASVVPFVEIGAEANYWRRTVVNLTTVTAIAQLHVPVLPFFVKAGVGYGSGNPDGVGNTSGTAGQLGIGYDIAVPAAPIGLTLFGTATLIHGSSRSLQMVEGGLALTWR